MCSTKSLHWFSPAAPSFCRYLKRVSWMPWPICSSVCMARDLSLRKSSGGFGCFRLGLLLFDRVSSHVCWAFYCSLQVSAMWRVPLLLSFHYLTPLLLTGSQAFSQLRNYRYSFGFLSGVQRIND